MEKNKPNDKGKYWEEEKLRQKKRSFFRGTPSRETTEGNNHKL